MRSDLAVPVKTGVLHVPALDAGATAAVLATLCEAGVQPLLIVESSAQSQRNWVADALCRWCDEEELDLVITLGGTLPAPGPGGREIVPEATGEILERELPGLAEAMRAYAAEESELALLERGRAGIRGRTLILNLPAGAGPAALFLEAVAHLIGPALAHLREEPDAPALADALDEAGAHGSAPDPPKGGGLRESDFAEFLRRSANDKAGGE